MASEPSRSNGAASGGASSGAGGGAADSYIGSLISLTSKSEIRYEGVLFNIDTDEASIGLRNVRSFGTEGRRKDGGPQVPPTDKVYEYIVFRGSDIKDLQVKSSPPVQTAPPVHNDPAIIQSHYSPPAAPSSLPPATTTQIGGPVSDFGTQHPQPGISRPTYPNSTPLYPGGGNLPPATTTQIGGLVSDFGTQNSQPGLSRPTYPNSTPLYPGAGNLPPATTTQIGGPVSDFGTQNPQSGLSRPTYPSSTPLYPGGGNLPPATKTQIGGPVSDFGTQNPQPGLSRPTYPNSSPLYPGGGNLSAWNQPPPPTANSGGLSVPMYWPGHYPPSGSIQPQQQSLFRPVPGLSMPPQQQPLLRPVPGFPMQPTLQPPLGQQPVMYPNMNSSFPTGPSSMSTSQSGVFPPPLIQPVASTTVSMPSTVMPVQSSALAVDSLSMMPPKAPPQAAPVASQTTNLSMGPSTLASSPMPYNSLSDTPSSSSPALVTPGQFLQLGSTNSQTSQMAQKDVEVVPVSSMHSAPPPPAEMPMAAAPVPVSTETQAPLLPLPSPVNPKMNGVSSQTRYVNRGGHGRGRGRGSEISRSVPQYTEDFDFEAMNERFKKDEVWGHLGKSTVRTDDGLDLEEEEDVDAPETDKKPVYKKDDFFDSLSCNALDRESRNPRPRFSEQMRLDTETFGEFSRNRGFRGGRGPSRGGRSRGGYNGRGSGYGYGYGYGYGGRGRGQNVYRAI